MWDQPINTDLLVTISYGMSLCFPKGVLQIVSRARGNTLGHGGPVLSASLDILSFRIPLVLSMLPDVW